MNTLVYTTNEQQVEDRARLFAKQNNMEFFSCKLNKDSSEQIKTIYEQYNDYVLFVSGLNKSKATDSVLKLLENNTKNIVMYAVSSTFDVKPAIEARFETIEKPIVNSTTEHNNIQFYIELADKIVTEHDNNMKHNLKVVSNIIDKIRMSTNNILWESLYEELEDNLIC